MLANWPSESSTVYYYRSYITEISENSIKVVNDNRHLENPLHLARTTSSYIVDDRVANKNELEKGTRVVVSYKDQKDSDGKYIAGVIKQFVFRWYEVQVSGSVDPIWKDIRDIRIRRLPKFCNRQTRSVIYRHTGEV